MNTIYLIAFFLLGTLFGSFLTVVGYRLPKNEDFIKTRSHCDTCNHTLSLLDMVPIISYIFLRGRCRYCKAKISDLSTNMEIFTGILFALAFFIFGFSYKLLIALGIVCLLIIISVSDLTYFIIPDEVLIFFSLYFLIIKFINEDFIYVMLSISFAILLFSIMYIIMLLGNFVFKKESLGGGDIKLMFVIGLILNPILGLIALFFASILALPVSLIVLFKKKLNIVPFGPFLIIGFMLIYFTQIDLNIVYKFLRLV